MPLTMYERVEDYWNISRIWRGQQSNSESLTVGDMITMLDNIRYFSGNVALRADKLCSDIIKGRRSRKRIKPPPNLVRLPLRQKTQNNSHELKTEEVQAL